MNQETLQKPLDDAGIEWVQTWKGRELIPVGSFELVVTVKSSSWELIGLKRGEFLIRFDNPDEQVFFENMFRGDINIFLTDFCNF